MDVNQTGINRRSFLKTAALAALGAFGSTALTGCANFDQQKTEAALALGSGLNPPREPVPVLSTATTEMIFEQMFTEDSTRREYTILTLNSAPGKNLEELQRLLKVIGYKDPNEADLGSRTHAILRKAFEDIFQQKCEPSTRIRVGPVMLMALSLKAAQVEQPGIEKNHDFLIASELFNDTVIKPSYFNRLGYNQLQEDPQSPKAVKARTIVIRTQILLQRAGLLKEVTAEFDRCTELAISELNFMFNDPKGYESPGMNPDTTLRLAYLRLKQTARSANFPTDPNTVYVIEDRKVVAKNPFRGIVSDIVADKEFKDFLDQGKIQTSKSP